MGFVDYSWGYSEWYYTSSSAFCIVPITRDCRYIRYTEKGLKYFIKQVWVYLDLIKDFILSNKPKIFVRIRNTC